MARNYSSMVDALTVSSTASTYHNVVYLATTAAVAVRPQVYDLIVSSPASPADVVIDWALQKLTAAPTGGTSVTPTPMNTGDGAATSLAMKGSTGGGTVSVVAMYFAMNQRVTWRWCAVPGGEVVFVPTASNGVGLQCVSAAASYPSMDSTIFFTE
jgi:hypothetical protein